MSTENNDHKLLPRDISLHTVSALTDFFYMSPNPSAPIFGTILLVAPISIMLLYQAAFDYEAQEKIAKLHLISVEAVNEFLEQINSRGGLPVESTIEAIKSIWRDSKTPWSVFYVEGEADQKLSVERLLFAIRNI